VDRVQLLQDREELLIRIAQGDTQVAHQEQFVRRCRQAGLPTERAEALLRVFLAAQATYRAGLANIERELGIPPSPVAE
jgi:hypothetical protein